MFTRYMVCPLCGNYVQSEEELEQYWECDDCGEFYSSEAEAEASVCSAPLEREGEHDQDEGD